MSAYKYRRRSEKELQIINNPIDQPTGTGRFPDVKSPNKSPEMGDNWNGALVSPFGQRVALWVDDINMNFQMTGTTGQSRYRRQFYPKSFNQASIIVHGQMPNEFEYNRLAAFVRECHYESLTGNQFLYKKKRGFPGGVTRNASASLQTIKFMLRRSPRQMGREGQIRKNVKGAHSQLIFEGYIKTISAGAMKFNYAPEFEFVIAASYLTGKTGIYNDTLVSGSNITSWNDQLKKYGYGQQKFVSNSGSRSAPSRSNNTPAARPQLSLIHI